MFAEDIIRKFLTPDRRYHWQLFFFYSSETWHVKIANIEAGILNGHECDLFTRTFIVTPRFAIAPIRIGAASCLRLSYGCAGGKNLQATERLGVNSGVMSLIALASSSTKKSLPLCDYSIWRS